MPTVVSRDYTPRALIQALLDCIAPNVGETVCDQACYSSAHA